MPMPREPLRKLTRREGVPLMPPHIFYSSSRWTTGVVVAGDADAACVCAQAQPPAAVSSVRRQRRAI
eukprot:COSAG02_NODE_8920_length_2400_cov_1.365928_2_plen_67_part_00